MSRVVDSGHALPNAALGDLNMLVHAHRRTRAADERVEIDTVDDDQTKVLSQAEYQQQASNS